MGLVDFSRFPRRSVLCIDVKSFFASVEAVRRGLDPLEGYIAVVSDFRRTGAVVLASYNVPACQDTKLKNLSYLLLPFLSAYAAIRYC